MNTQDFIKYQEELLNDSSHQEEQVSVNQRHLIDKILARYSSEHTIFRELLQNSNDAGASKVQIRFRCTMEEKNSKSSSFLPDSWLPWSKETANCTSISYSNNGAAFSEEDFKRLRKIAEGNPDEAKIGFFGVGFYSLFSICENPFITSGTQSMAFYWKENTLFTKRGRIPDDKVTEWTTFFLQGREKIPLPGRTEFAKFIATSMAFATNLNQIEVFVDNERVSFFDRKNSVPRPIEIDISHFNRYSSQKIFYLRDIGISQAQIDMELMDESQNPCNFTIFMKVATAGKENARIATHLVYLELAVNLPKRLAEEMLRTTKKSAPKATKVNILMSNFEEYDSTMQTIRGREDVFLNLIPSPLRQGRVYIGFPTHQTTGCGVSFAGHFIATVERESIDFADKHLTGWNVELTSTFGLLSRICFEHEMNTMDKLLQHMDLDEKSSLWFYQKLAFLQNLFLMKESTPSQIVGHVSMSNFNSCSKLPFRMISTTGKLVPLSLLRIIDSELTFIKSLPLVPTQLEDLCPDVIKHFKSLGLLKAISMDDVFIELSNRALQKEDFSSFLKYWIKQVKLKNVFRNDIERLRSVLKIDTGDSIIQMSNISKFIFQPFFPKEIPLPPYCLDSEYCKGFSSKELETCVCLKELSAIEWIKFSASLPSFQVSVVFTETVMAAISRLYSSSNKLSNADKVTVISLLANMKCISTEKHGLCVPKECYFANVSLFEDLPKISAKYSDSLLKDLDVRDHVDLQLIFDRLHDQLKWDQTKLIKYLASIQEKLKPSEISSLRNSALFSKENGAEIERFRANQLFPPIEKFRSFKLPLLDWKNSGRWKFTSLEASLMQTLGLNSMIQLPDLINMIVNSSIPEKFSYLKLFASEPKYELSYSANSITVPFVMLKNSSDLALPTACYTDDGCSLMGFPVCDKLMKPFALKLGIQDAPSGELLVHRLQKSPPSLDVAEKVFEFLQTRSSTFTASNWTALKALRFIPVKSIDSNVVYNSPCTVFLSSKNESMLNHFTYVHYSPLATQLLKSCGCNEQPSPVELAEKLSTSPESFLQNGYSFYLDLLRQIAANYYQIRQDRRVLNLMKSSKFLIALKSQDEGKEKAFSLENAAKIFLIDDPVLVQVFRPYTAPIEPSLEIMYQDLGSTWLSKNVQERYCPTGEVSRHDVASKLQVTIRERAMLLLYDGNQVREKSELINGARNLLEKIEILLVPKIEIFRSFGNDIKTQETTACIHRADSLLVTKGFDYFDVASVICKLIFKTPRLNDSLLISTFLSSSLENLTRKGFPVERIIMKETPPVTRIIASPPEQQQLPIEPPLSRSQTNEETSKDGFSDFFSKITDRIGIAFPFPPKSESSSKKALENSIANVKNANDKRIISIPSSGEQFSRPSIMQQSCHEVKDLIFVQKLSRYINLYCATGFLDKAPFTDTESLGEFAGLLEILSTKVFGITSAISIFWDPEGRTIAFNRGRELYFNFRHYLLWRSDRISDSNYWYIVFCHELAHNEHAPHDETHEYWLSSFASQYMEKLFMIRTLLQQGGGL